MYLAYVDESGNSALPPGGTVSYSLGCVLVEARLWPAIFDDVIAYRRYLRDSFGIPMRTEIKANYLLRNGGPHFSQNPLGEDIRHRVYRGFMRLLPKLKVRVFGVVVKKDAMKKAGLTADPRVLAWGRLIQRLERFSTKGATPLMLVHDEGDAPMIRQAMRKARRAGTAGSAFGTGTIQVRARFFVDDPVPRRSDQSYFVQLADLVAYAAFRYVYPPGAKIAAIVPQGTWNEIGEARFLPVSSLAGGPPGLVVGS